ncbi:hypothetical protein Dimus_005507 [Dionaea muscipula]
MGKVGSLLRSLREEKTRGQNGGQVRRASPKGRVRRVGSGEQGRRARSESKAREQGRRAGLEGKVGGQGRRARPESKVGEQGRRVRSESNAGEQGRRASPFTLLLCFFSGEGNQGETTTDVLVKPTTSRRSSRELRRLCTNEDRRRQGKNREGENGNLRVPVRSDD